MSKHYNLTVTDDNGKSVTTSNTSTEHPEEVLRMMQLAGMQSEPQCGMESVEENEYQATPANDKLDLDDYSKKSPESISKQPKKLQPSRGDNPLEYSLDENEIYESLMAEIEKVEEKAKPDFADIDKDGDEKETMKKAAKDKKEKTNEEITNELNVPNDKETVKARIRKLDQMAKDARDAGDSNKAYSIERSSEMAALYNKLEKLGGDPFNLGADDWVTPEGGPLSYKKVGEYTYIVKDENGKEHKAEMGAMGDEQDNYSGDEIEQTMDQEGLQMLIRQAKKGAPTHGDFKSPEGGPLSYKRVGEYTYIVKDENGKEHKAEAGATDDTQDNYSGDEVEQTMDQEGLEMLIRQAKMGAPVREEESEHCTCDCDCDKTVCESCGKPHKKSKKEATDLDRLRKLAGNEKVDELAPLAILPAIGMAAGRALVSKGIKGAVSRAAATTVASKALNKNNNPQ
tara:strand:- start:5814 stop:7181 length:1368 start_codon:yes stop_codon:yes gene_type:complete